MLPLGLRVLDKLEGLIDHHMRSLDASKVSLSSLTSESLWKKTGRYEKVQSELFGVTDRRESGFVLAPTHEEEITSIVGDSIRSSSDLPLRLYQITRKYRDELRPRQGLLRAKEFIMKDLYTFDADHDSALQAYDAVKEAYNALFTNLGLPFVVAQADSGVMGGSLSHEYHYLSPDGEDTVHICGTCGYAVNDEAVDATAQQTAATNATDGPATGIICPKCPDDTNSTLAPQRAVEVGHTFHLGTRYTAPLHATVSIAGKDTPMHMGCHGIGVSRLMAAVASQLSDATGLVWPRAIAPFDVAVIPKSLPGSPSWLLVERVYERLRSVRVPNRSGGGARLDVAVDDRSGKKTRSLVWKLNEADVVGYPIVLVVPGRNGDGSVEVQCRRLGVKESVKVEDLVHKVQELSTKL
ncbi:class II aaRS and biotin synthetase [Eremomyces bilateralis CBS 781.70]|uniref:proline--tRNA ligase n=1 Tax=Eremomyces bilateralis CBS 781.70 TaxID=1392243 RepID=A0A6G1GFR4_9PEZI|nr:class II aaRS and biotin synthetase [Eremomyces bilateralis CBS 781.70]KAF1816918.1 class II aaRS and biotin synthetase [Eremomyces bilateralis CBS 781.70]